tara:strand:+ start:232 stop:1011 length:780 start_codon:yes stop_codon:yes gene_type:complete
MHNSLEHTYNQRYRDGYREHLLGFEIARWSALKHFIKKVLKLTSPPKVLDYGAGSGLYLRLWEKLFPHSELYFCDISSGAREKFNAKYQNSSSKYFFVKENKAQLRNDTFDVVVSVEVMEHVSNLQEYLLDIHRLLKHRGVFIWTTPCSNPLSIEHIYGKATNGIEQTIEGYERWKWEDPTHLRRLRSREIKKALQENGFLDVRFRFRAHFFSFLCTSLPFSSMIPFRDRIMKLDYNLLRLLPNAASMIGAASCEKRNP